MEARLTLPTTEDLPAFARSPLWPWVGSAPFILWPLYLFSRGEFRWEVIALMVGVPALAFASAATRRFFTGLYPIGLVAVLYDAMRLVKGVGVTAERVHVCDLRAAEVALFGVTVDGRGSTVHDWFVAHPSRALDLLCAIPYGTYIFSVIGVAAFLYSRDFLRLQRFAWTFLLLNVAGFITYHVYPAAPPWYFHAHGCAVDLGARASEGPALARVDALLGVRYFHGFYSRSNDVFGAVPSLHVAYPTLIALEGWRYFRPAFRVGALLYAGLMFLAATYLDHHWIIDVLLGLAYTLVLVSVVRRAFARVAPAAPARLAAAGPTP